MLKVLRKEYVMIKDSKRKVHQVTEEYISPNSYYSILTKNTCCGNLILIPNNTKEAIWYDTGIT